MTPFNVAIVNWVRRAFDFRGRATRSDYWWPRLLVFVVNLVLLSVFLAGGGLDWLVALIEWMESDSTDFGDLDLPPLSRLSTFAATFLVVFGLATFIPDISIAFRRFHDMGKPGWLHIIFMIGGAFVNVLTVVELIWFAFPGERGSNRYGPDPLDAQADVF